MLFWDLVSLAQQSGLEDGGKDAEMNRAPPGAALHPPWSSASVLLCYRHSYSLGQRYTSVSSLYLSLLRKTFTSHAITLVL